MSFDRNQLFVPELIHNHVWIMSEEDALTHMSPEEYQKDVADHKQAEDKLIILNADATYDSCDCGDGYGCSHGSWLDSISFRDQPKTKEIDPNDDETEVVFDAGGVQFVGPIGYFHLNDDKNMTIGDFIKYCELVGIVLKLKE